METREEIDRRRGITALPFSVALDFEGGMSGDIFVLPEDRDEGEGVFLGQDFTGNFTL